MKFLKNKGLILALLLLFITTPFFVAATLAAELNDDSWTAQTGILNNDQTNGLLVGFSNFPNFTPNEVSYLRFDLSASSGAFQSTSKLRLYVESIQVASDLVGEDIELYAVSDDWNGGTSGNGDETTLTGNNQPTGGMLLDTQTIPSAGNWIGFGGTALVNYLNTEMAGDQLVSFRVQIGSYTGSEFGGGLRIEDRENSLGTGSLPEITGELAVTLASFNALSQQDHVLVDWDTLIELDNLGFNLLRSTSVDGEKVVLNQELIPSQAPGSGQGASYSFQDYNVEDGTTYYYWLENVDSNGMVIEHGPVSVTYESNPSAIELESLETIEKSKVPWETKLLGSILLLAGAGYLSFRCRWW